MPATPGETSTWASSRWVRRLLSMNSIGNPPQTGAPSLAVGALFGALWTGALVAASAIANALVGAPNAAYLLFEAVARTLPGALVTFGIDAIVGALQLIDVGSTASAAKTAQKALAVTMALAAGAAVGVIVAAVARASKRSPTLLGLAAGVIVMVIPWWLPETITRTNVGGLIALDIGLLAWGALIGASVSAGREPTAGSVAEVGRRNILRLLAGGAVAFTGIAFAVSRWLTRGPAPSDGAMTAAKPADLPDRPPSSITPVDGTRRELTRNADFYRVDINLHPPDLDADTWRLQVGGLVARPLSLSLEELRARPALTRTITLECISNPVGGDLISTARWTGLRLAELLPDAGVQPGAGAVAIRSADGFHESASLKDATADDALLVYEMNGVSLPVEHGYPLRLYMPNRHGMKLPKWIERIDLVEEVVPGYWVERGWSREAIVHTTSVIDAVRTRSEAGEIRISAGGIAYAGSRGIRRVEVRVDEGPWREAALRLPPLGQLTWVQWRYDGPVSPGRHRLRVRATDGAGALQVTESSPPHPDGATGLHSVSFSA